MNKGVKEERNRKERGSIRVKGSGDKRIGRDNQGCKSVCERDYGRKREKKKVD